jgi:hypothetical protein
LASAIAETIVLRPTREASLLRQLLHRVHQRPGAEVGQVAVTEVARRAGVVGYDASGLGLWEPTVKTTPKCLDDADAARTDGSRMWDAYAVRTSFLGVAAADVALVAARPGLANGRFPASNQIVFSATNEKIIVGRATYAILPSNDNGQTWGYLCEDVLGLLPVGYQDPEIGLTANNSIVAGLYSPTVGLDVSGDLGCNWSCVGGPLANQQIADIVVLGISRGSSRALPC